MGSANGSNSNGTALPSFFLAVSIMHATSRKRKAQSIEKTQTAKKRQIETVTTQSKVPDLDQSAAQDKAALQSRSDSNGVTQTLGFSGQDSPSHDKLISTKMQGMKANPDRDQLNKPDMSVSRPSKAEKKIRKLAPQRPFPNVPTSASATGPRSAHKDGKNMICITRKTPLGAYLRRCKAVVMEDGCVTSFDSFSATNHPFYSYRVLHLHALGAAIPHLVRLSMSLPDILPFSKDDVHTEVTTGTLEVRDEVLPDDEDQDISLQSRSKSTLTVVMTFGDGLDERNQVVAKRNSIVRPTDVDDDSQSEIGEIVMQELSDG